MKLYIYISTDSVYDVCDKNHSHPSSETDSVRPQSLDRQQVRGMIETVRDRQQVRGMIETVRDTDRQQVMGMIETVRDTDRQQVRGTIETVRDR